MASASTQHVLLSPAELAYLHSSLSLSPPIRPDGRSPTQFRPLTADTGILPGTNGSARVCFADGTEAAVGVKAEVERTKLRYSIPPSTAPLELAGGRDAPSSSAVTGDPEWLELTVEIPGLRDDDANTVFLAAMLGEALLADGDFTKRLWINSRFHWKLYIDVILISPPLSYPLPLLSLTTHLALLATRLPRLKSEGDEDPMFDDDWDASPFLYPQKGKSRGGCRPPVTLLVTAVGDNVIFDPAKEELAVADVAVAVSVAEADEAAAPGDATVMDVDPEEKTAAMAGRSNLRLLSVRVIDPPARLTPPGAADAPDATSAVAAGGVVAPKQRQPEARTLETEGVEGVWKAPRGGTKLAVLNAIVQKVLQRGGIADEVLDALEAVDLS